MAITGSPFPDFEGTAIPFDNLDAQLAEAGAVVLRGLVPRALIEHWLPRFLQAFEEADTQVYTGQMPASLYQSLYRYGHVYPPTIPHYEQWHQALLQHRPFQQVLRSFFGDRCALMIQNSYPRRQGRSRSEHAIDWHQDQAFLGPLPVINTWIPMTPAGGNYPGVELALSSGACWIPELQPGDVLIFHAFTRHRTFLPDNFNERISSELRWIAPAGFEFTSSPLFTVNLGEATDAV